MFYVEMSIRRAVQQALTPSKPNVMVGARRARMRIVDGTNESSKVNPPALCRVAQISTLAPNRRRRSAAPCKTDQVCSRWPQNALHCTRINDRTPCIFRHLRRACRRVKRILMASNNKPVPVYILYQVSFPWSIHRRNGTRLK